MTCPHCEKAKEGLWHGFASGCAGCDRRELIRSPMVSPHLNRVRRTKRLDVIYTRAIEAQGITHAEAKAALEDDMLFHMEPN